VLLVGIDSLIGNYLSSHLGSLGYKIYGTTRRKINTSVKNDLFFLDLSEKTISFPKIQFDIAIICAGISNNAFCEDFQEESRKINFDKTIEVIKYFLDSDTYVIFLSSNAVFDGTKQFYKYFDEVSPITNYGNLKSRVESFINDKNYCVLRLTKVFTPNMNFLVQLENNFKLGKELKAFTNLFISPITLNQVGDALHRLISSRAGGIFQLGGEFEMSYYDFAINYFSKNANFVNSILPEIYSRDASNKYNSLTTHLS
jgi:dTDP-4-dehydrorhamnose reductase